MLRRPDDPRRGHGRPRAVQPALRSAIRALAAAFLLVIGCGGPPRPADSDRVYYPPAPEQPRVRFLARIYSSDDVDKQSGFNKFVVGEKDKALFGKPYGLAMHDGVIYVCDTQFGALVEVDLVKGRFETLDLRGPGKLQKPINIAITAEGTKFIADADRGQIVVVGADNRFRGTYGEPGTMRPTAVAVTDAEVYVSDVDGHRIIVFDRETGEILRTFGGRGNAEGEFDHPTNLAVDVTGNLYVTETINCRVQKLTPEGEHLMNIGRLGDIVGDFARPKGLAISREGHVYVVDAAFENVQIFDPKGEVMLFFGGPGIEPGNMWLPAGLAIDYDNVELFRDRIGEEDEVEYLVLVTSQFGPPHIDVYGFLGSD